MFDSYIQGEEGWSAAYKKGGRKRVWIYVKFSNGQEIYLSDYPQWLELKAEVEASEYAISEIGLRYRSHKITVDTAGTDGVYLVRALQAQFGGDTVHFYTVGLVHGNTVNKTRWHTPSLVEESSEETTLDECFEEALIYHGKTEDQQ